MAFIWGGSKSLSEIAAKFSWPSVIVSLLLTPFLLLWKHLFAYPFWLMALVPHGPYYLRKTIVSYPDKGDGKDDQYRERLYLSKTSEARLPIAGWNVLADVEGGKFFESFWGLIQCLDLEASDDKLIMSSNWLSWFPVDNVFIEFPKAPVYEHIIRFYLPLDGPNKYNPFCFLTAAFALSAITFASKYSLVDFQESLSMSVESTMFPPAEDPDTLNPNKSFKKYPMSSQRSDYGAV